MNLCLNQNNCYRPSRTTSGMRELYPCRRMRTINHRGICKFQARNRTYLISLVKRNQRCCQRTHRRRRYLSISEWLSPPCRNSNSSRYLSLRINSWVLGTHYLLIKLQQRPPRPPSIQTTTTNSNTNVFLNPKTSILTTTLSNQHAEIHINHHYYSSSHHYYKRGQLYSSNRSQLYCNNHSSKKTKYQCVLLTWLRLLPPLRSSV
jgi:hypothetical protein